jgi:MFS family permease
MAGFMAPADSSSNPFRVFQNREYALYFGGQLVSQVGTWMQQIALSWLTYKMTSSPLLLAVVGVCGQMPSLIIMPLAGVMADRFNRHRIVVLTQTFGMIQASLLAYLTLTHQVHIWYLIALGLMMGVINAFDMPVRSAFVYNMIKEKEDLPAAVAMNSSLMNFSRLLGPALAGFVVATVGEGMCFLLNALSYIAVITALMFIHGNFEPKPASQKTGMFKELADGFQYAMATTPIRATILLMAIFGFGGMAYAMLLPVFVKEIGGNATTLGYLSTASALGSILGTGLLATRKNIRGIGRWIVCSSFAYALALFAFGFAHTFWMAVPVLAVLGGAIMLQMGFCY